MVRNIFHSQRGQNILYSTLNIKIGGERGQSMCRRRLRCFAKVVRILFHQPLRFRTHPPTHTYTRTHSHTHVHMYTLTHTCAHVHPHSHARTRTPTLAQGICGPPAAFLLRLQGGAARHNTPHTTTYSTCGSFLGV